MFAYITNILKGLFTKSQLPLDSTTSNHIDSTIINHIDLEKAYIEECASNDLEEVPLFQPTQSPKPLESLSQQLWGDMAKDINIPHLDEHIHVVQKDVRRLVV